MKEKQTILDAFDVVGIDNIAIIICSKTGIFYTSQSGGMGCSHPKQEGFVIPYNCIFENFDDCSIGCSYISDDIELKRKVAAKFNVFCVRNNLSLKFRFDYSRIEETQEGWIPIIINGYIIDRDNFFKDQKAILVTGNCD